MPRYRIYHVKKKSTPFPDTANDMPKLSQKLANIQPKGQNGQMGPVAKFRLENKKLRDIGIKLMWLVVGLVIYNFKTKTRQP